MQPTYFFQKSYFRLASPIVIRVEIGAKAKN